MLPDTGREFHVDIKGYSIVELLTVMAVIVILMAAASPSLISVMIRNQSVAELNRLVGAVNLTRHSAVQFATTATLCGLKPTGRCGAPWDGKLTVFLDRNGNARLDGNDETISFISSLDSDSTVKWRSFQNRQYLQMTSQGYTRYQNGNFVVCPVTADVRQARQLVINVQGRTRVNHKVNKAGLPVDYRGRVLRC